MKVYTCTFEGIYPVGACAVVVAKSGAHARDLLYAELVKMGPEKNNQALELIEVNTSIEGATILLDGNC